MKNFGFADTYYYPDCDFHQMKEICAAAGYGFKMGNCHGAADVIEFGKDCEVICVGYELLTEEIFEALPNLKAVIRFGIGVDAVDVESATRHNVYVCNLPTYCLEDVSQMALAFIFDMVRKITFYDRECRKGVWNVAHGNYPATRLSAKKLGLLGFGNIARALYKQVIPFGMEVIAYDAYLPDSIFEEYGCKRVSLDELLAESDIISIHVPATKETNHLICKETIAKMKDGVMIVNTARGPIVCVEDLVEACKSGKVGAAALDVVEGEPINDANHILFSVDNIINTPHVAYNTVEASEAMHIQTAETAVKVMNGEVPANRVNFR